MTEYEELMQLADDCFSETLNYLHSSRLKLALETGLRAREIYVEINDRRKEASINNVLSIIYENMGNHTLELQFLLDALDIAIDENAYDISAKLYNNLGSKLLFAKSYDLALSYFHNAIEMAKKADAEKLFKKNSIHDFNIVINMNLATIYCNKGDFKGAGQWYELAKAETKQPISDELRFPFLAFEGLYFWRTGERDKANALVDEIMEVVEKNPYTTDHLEVFLDIIEIFREMGDCERWEKVLRIMDENSEEDTSIYQKIEILNQWINFYEKTGDTKKYCEACTKYYQLAKERTKQDYEREANTIELNAQMRRTLRQKKESDSIVYIDSLTGIGNRNKMLCDSKSFIEESICHFTPITVGLLDIDFFKEKNDAYGHIEGDRTLRAVADVIQDALGEDGSVYRYGGDEFLIIMPISDVNRINQVGKTIKDNLEAVKIPNEKSPINPYVTISQGYTCAIAQEGDTIDSLVMLADRVLYSVKRRGVTDIFICA